MQQTLDCNGEPENTSNGTILSESELERVLFQNCLNAQLELLQRSFAGNYRLSLAARDALFDLLIDAITLLSPQSRAVLEMLYDFHAHSLENAGYSPFIPIRDQERLRSEDMRRRKQRELVLPFPQTSILPETRTIEVGSVPA